MRNTGIEGAIDSDPSTELITNFEQLVKVAQLYRLDYLDLRHPYIKRSISTYQGYPRYTETIQDEDEQGNDVQTEVKINTEWHTSIEGITSGKPRLILEVRCATFGSTEKTKTNVQKLVADNAAYKLNPKYLLLEVSIENIDRIFEEIYKLVLALEKAFDEPSISQSERIDNVNIIIKTIAQGLNQVSQYLNNFENNKERQTLLAQTINPNIITVFNIYYDEKEKDYPIIKPESIAKYYFLTRACLSQGYTDISYEQQIYLRDQILTIAKEMFSALFYLNLGGDYRSKWDPNGEFASRVEEASTFEEIKEIYQEFIPKIEEVIKPYITGKRKEVSGWEEVALILFMLGEELTIKTPRLRLIISLLEKFIHFTHSGNEESTISQRLVRFNMNALLPFLIASEGHSDPKEISCLFQTLSPLEQEEVLRMFPQIDIEDYTDLDVLNMILESEADDLKGAFWRNLINPDLRMRGGTNSSNMTFEIANVGDGENTSWKILCDLYTKFYRFSRYDPNKSYRALNFRYEDFKYASPIMCEFLEWYPKVNKKLFEKLLEKLKVENEEPDFNAKKVLSFLQDNVFSQTLINLGKDRYELVKVPESNLQILLIDQPPINIQIAAEFTNLNGEVKSKDSFVPIVFINGVEVTSLESILSHLGIVQAIKYKFQQGD